MRSSLRSLLIFALLFGVVASEVSAQEKEITEEEYEREELGVNRYTAPSIARIFQQLDDLKPLPFDQLKRDFPPPTPMGREQTGMLFGSLVADGFLIAECEKKDLVEDFGRILIRQAKSLGVGDRVMRHSASLMELGRRGEWEAIRKELTATQSDVEQAMIDLRDQKLAHLISLGGWLRGLEISAGAVEADFSPQRAKVLFQPDLVNYFREELRTLPPPIIHTPLFNKIRTGVDAIRSSMSKARTEGLNSAEVKFIHAQAREINLALRRAG